MGYKVTIEQKKAWKQGKIGPITLKQEHNIPIYFYLHTWSFLELNWMTPSPAWGCWKQYITTNYWQMQVMLIANNINQYSKARKLEPEWFNHYWRRGPPGGVSHHAITQFFFQFHAITHIFSRFHAIIQTGHIFPLSRNHAHIFSDFTQ